MQPLEVVRGLIRSVQLVVEHRQRQQKLGVLIFAELLQQGQGGRLVLQSGVHTHEGIADPEVVVFAQLQRAFAHRRGLAQHPKGDQGLEVLIPHPHIGTGLEHSPEVAYGIPEKAALFHLGVALFEKRLQGFQCLLGLFHGQCDLGHPCVQIVRLKLQGLVRVFQPLLLGPSLLGQLQIIHRRFRLRQSSCRTGLQLRVVVFHKLRDKPIHFLIAHLIPTVGIQILVQVPKHLFRLSAHSVNLHLEASFFHDSFRAISIGGGSVTSIFLGQ